MIILETFIILLFTFLLVLFIYSKYLRYSTGDYINPVLYLGNKKCIEKDAFYPVKNYHIDLSIDTVKQRQFIILVNKQIKLFAKEYSFKNKIKIFFDSFLIRNFYRVFGNIIIEYYIQCTLLNKLYNFCRKYNNLDLFYKLFEYFLELFWSEYTKDISINKFVIKSFNSHPQDIMFYIIINWNN